ncbi:hypothetical protein [Sanguibacter massiliensis]|uniref:hypothetical protein n=1 Tax=Sanguibacter massiliensis TaxID=1973217 RepID=UPI000C860973|nr:hypothetical protein [Sanguibacter massiliensis]
MTRTITDPSELEALPVGSGIVDKHGDLGLIDRVNREIVVQYAQAGLVSLANAKRYLPATVVHDPSEARTESTPAQVVSDAAVEAATAAVRRERAFAAAAAYGAGAVPQCAEMIAYAALSAALPFLGAAPSATREDVARMVSVDALDALASIVADGEADEWRVTLTFPLARPATLASWRTDLLDAITPRTDR